MNIEEINNLIRDDSYINKLYNIREETVIKNMIKLYASTIDKSQTVIITKQLINIDDDDIVLRILNMSKFIEDNVILVENMWIEESDNSIIWYNIEYSLYISEFTKEIYRMEYGLCNLTYHCHRSKGNKGDVSRNMKIVGNFLNKIKILHDEGVYLIY